MDYTVKILKITSYKEVEDKQTSPYRESKGLSPTGYDVYIEAEIILVKGYIQIRKSLRAILLSFLKKLLQISTYTSDINQMKTSLITTIGFCSFEEMDRYDRLTEIKKYSQELETMVTLSRLKDLSVGELIKFSYPNPTRSEIDYNLNLIRYENRPLTLENFKDKLYPSRIDNTLEDSAIKYINSFIGLCYFEKLKTSVWKGIWFRLQAKYPVLLEIKQALFYKKRSTWEKCKVAIGVILGVISILYVLKPEWLSNPKHRVVSIIAAIINMIKEIF